ncbi:MAG: hypothetical protein EHM18_09905 [Acidobacteria bacterium]|nr:MAG: hypothetical protein EHM18_09905 [Acidobacteriota bacterium]
MPQIIAPILFIAAIIYVAYPLVSDRILATDPEAEESGRERLLNEKDEIISSLKDMEMDYRMGKLSLQDYTQLRVDFERRAADVLKRLDDNDDER